MKDGRLTDQSTLTKEFRRELESIADWWSRYSVDTQEGGFYGEVGADNRPVPDADKGVVLNTRILWFYSELAAFTESPEHRLMADRAYQYLADYFVDAQHGGVYWTLDAKGQPVDTKKQVYAQAFAIYAWVAYYRATENEQALTRALDCFDLLEKYAVDPSKGGYLEAFARDWTSLDDVRLSDKDLNFPKTMNTHLHVVEAYSLLNKVVSRQNIREALQYSLSLFDEHIIDKSTNHLRMFMDHGWGDHSPGYTYGHDIECSWLLAKAAESLGDTTMSHRLRPSIIGLADACLAEAMDEQGAMMDGYVFAAEANQPERVWWVQAEALVGYLKVYTLTEDERYLDAAQGVWSFIKQHQIDSSTGEWFWLSTLDGASEPSAYKSGFWKGPYHNGRAMMEAIWLLQRCNNLR